MHTHSTADPRSVSAVELMVKRYLLAATSGPTLWFTQMSSHNKAKIQLAGPHKSWGKTLFVAVLQEPICIVG